MSGAVVHAGAGVAFNIAGADMAGNRRCAANRMISMTQGSLYMSLFKILKIESSAHGKSGGARIGVNLGRSVFGALLFVGSFSAPIHSADKSTLQQVPGQGVIYSRQGFHPSQITRAAGRVVFFVDNRSDNRTPTFRLEVEHGAKVQEASVPIGRGGLAQIVDLVPGTYLLYETSRSTLTCRIVVTAK